MKKLLLAIVLVMSAGSVQAGMFSKDVWTGFVYPDVTDLTVHKDIGGYGSLPACREAAFETMKSLLDQEQYKGNTANFECGLNCEYDNKIGINICEKTEQ